MSHRHKYVISKMWKKDQTKSQNTGISLELDISWNILGPTVGHYSPFSIPVADALIWAACFVRWNQLHSPQCRFWPVVGPSFLVRDQRNVFDDDEIEYVCLRISTSHRVFCRSVSEFVRGHCQWQRLAARLWQHNLSNVPWLQGLWPCSTADFSTGNTLVLFHLLY